MTGDELRVMLGAALADFAGAAEEVGRLDARVGDGDLGVTLAGSTQAAIGALHAQAPGSTPAQVLATVAAALADANPSTLATLTSAGVGAGATAIEGRDSLAREDALAFAEAAAATIARLGRSKEGDKTVLDALLPSVETLRTSTGDARAAVADMIAAARGGIEATQAQVARKGRARWVGERAAGVPDPGAVAYLRLLESVERTLPG